ncbi:MAG: maleylpyruvate isomerase N-terminal domain-containing protein [Spirochaetaceae bacterium]|nr:maleylpyruvate isomerase N-terminal domain-containing protein [Spirochaetaceae bacterium]
MNKREVISSIKTERARWNALVAQVDDDRMLQPEVDGGWSGKDIVAHVIWYEREMVGMLKSRVLPGSNLWALPVHERNAAVHEEINDLTLQEVRAWDDRTFAALIDQLELLPEEGTSTPRTSSVCLSSGFRGR